ncbi:MAG: site-specific integrase [Atopobiaceae bacterium]|nr:site-specific integrase [Atopobiaceae bacterium]
MATFASGLSYEALKSAADNNALNTLSRGGIRKNGKRLQVTLCYKTLDGKRRLLAHNVDAVTMERLNLSDEVMERNEGGTKASGRGKTNKGDRAAIVSAWRELVVHDIKSVAGVNDDPTISVREACERYISGKVVVDEDGKMVGARASTLTFYRYCAKRLDVLPRLANKSLIDVTQADVDEWVKKLSATHSEKSIRDSLHVLDATCRQVMKGKVSPCADVEIPKNVRKSKRGPKSRPNALTKDGVRRVNSLLNEREAKYKGIDLMTVGARIALHTAMRAEEVAGLRWHDVDFINGQVYVRNVIERAELPELDKDGNKVYDKRGHVKTTYHEFDAEPKTKGSIRDVPMDAELARILKKHRADVAALLGAMPEKERPSIDSLYVVGRLDGTHYSPHRIGDNFRAFCRVRGVLGTEGVVVGFHDLRHTWATLSINDGMPISEVSRILGHSDIHVTLSKYVGEDKEKQREIVDAMNDVFSACIPDDVDMLKPA